MPPQLELLVALLELAAFFLVTPEVIGRPNLMALFTRMGRLTSWLRRVWFSPDFGPVPPASALLLIVMVGLTAAALLGLDVPHSQMLVAALAAPLVIGPAAFLLLYLLLQALHRRDKLGRTLAIVGAILFVVGRVIVIASAYSRWSP